MNKIFYALLAVAITTISPQLTHADTSKSPSPKLKDSMAKVKDQCKSDISKFCGDVTPGKGRVAACLQSKEDKLSESCRTAYVGALDDLSKRMERAELAFRRECGPDVQKFCSEVPSGQGRLWNCLENHEGNLSNSCKNFQVRLEQKVDDYLS